MTQPFIARSWCTALLLLGVSGLCRADTVWQCWYDRALHVACSLSQAAPATALDAAQKQALALGAAAVVRPGRLPLLVHILHTNPGALRGQFVRIPLHALRMNGEVVNEETRLPLFLGDIVDRAQSSIEDGEAVLDIDLRSVRLSAATRLYDQPLSHRTTQLE